MNTEPDSTEPGRAEEPDPVGSIGWIVDQAEEYAAAEAEKAVARQLAEGASPSHYAIVRFRVYPAAFSGAYYDRYFQLIRQTSPRT